MPLARDSIAALSQGGALATAMPAFRPRAAQQALAQAVAECLPERGELLAEAGTGTGKTYAYLVPALLSGERVLLSTATKALQDQLFGRDLPQNPQFVAHITAAWHQLAAFGARQAIAGTLNA